MNGYNVSAQWNNHQLLLWKIKGNSPISKRELQDVTGLSWGLISRLTNALTEEGYIVPYVRQSQGVGRKAEEYDINNERNYFIGIDLSYNGIVSVLTDMKGRIIEQNERKFAVRERECALEQLFEMTDHYFRDFRDNGIMGIGFAVQGVVNRRDGISVRINKIKDWNNVPLKQIVEERYCVPVSVEHNPDCLIKCESAFGCLKGSKATEVLMIKVDYSTGIGMSVMIRGQIYYGFHGKAGEIGYTIINRDADGAVNRLEDQVTKEGIVKAYRKLTGENDEISYSDVVEHAGKNEEICRDIYGKLGTCIGDAVSSACNFLNPQVVVIYAGSCEYSDVLFAAADDFVHENTYDKSVEIRLSKLQKEATAIGAALVAVENAIQKI